MTHWTDKNAAQAAIGESLAALGWKLHGYTEDKSDAMTDYYAPAHWHGIATKGQALALVDCADNGKEGYTVQTTKGVDAGACTHCAGTGKDPSGWTYAKARLDPRKYHAETDPPGTFSLSPNVVSPIPFLDDAERSLRCRAPGCHGGRIFNYHTVTTVETPPFTPLEGRQKWSVQVAGRVLASGCTLNYVACARYGEEGRKAADEIARKIDQAAQQRTSSSTGDAVNTPAGRLQDNNEKDGLEIHFAHRPPPPVLEALKAAGWRWSRFSACWYTKRTDRARSFARALLGLEAPELPPSSETVAQSVDARERACGAIENHADAEDAAGG